MARQNRRDVIDESECGCYHIWSRCNRQGYLCGYNKIEDKDFSHRRCWIEERIKFLAGIFMIDVLGYGVLSNHSHQVLRNRPDLAARLSNRQVAERIWRLRHETDASDDSQRRKKKRRESTKLAKISAIANDVALIDEYRAELSSVSKFMENLNHRIAVRANREDGVTGHFFDGRFRAKRITSMEQLLATLVYIDLNPIRAGMADSLETNRYTSVYTRAKAIKQRKAARTQRGLRESSENAVHRWADDFLSPIDVRDETRPVNTVRGKSDVIVRPMGADHGLVTPVGRASDKGCFEFSATEYVAIVDAAARFPKTGKGHIPAGVPPILEKLGIRDPRAWLQFLQKMPNPLRSRLPANTDGALRWWKMPNVRDRNQPHVRKSLE